MADLLTRIGADDADFQRGLARTDERITGFTGSVRNASREIHHLVTGFGVLALANHFLDLGSRVAEVREEVTKTKEAFDEMGNSAIEASRQRIGVARGDEATPESVREEASRRADAIRKKASDEAAKTTSWFGDPIGNFWRFATTGRIPADHVKTLTEVSKDNAEKVLEQGNREAAEIRRRRRNEEEKRLGESANDSGAELKKQQEANREHQRQMADRQISIMSGAGLGRQSDLARLAESNRKDMQAIDENYYLTPQQKREASKFYEANYDANKLLINDKWESRWRGMAKSFQGNVGGATFAQQMADIQRPLNTVNEEIRDAALKILAEMQVISAKENVTSYN